MALTWPISLERQNLPMTGTHGGLAGEAAFPAITWRVSSRCAGNGECVAVAQFPNGQIAVRDTKDPAGRSVAFSAADWSTFLSRVRAGEFDR
jgi:hypothetical protein